MRQVISVFAVAGAIALLAGCASGTAAPSAAPAAGAPGSASGAPIAVESTPPAGTPAPSTPAPSASASGHSTTPSSPKPSTPHSTASHSKPTPGTAPTSFGYSATADAKAQIDAARAAAKADGREVLLDFGASWCGNCVAMDQDFRTPQVQSVLAASYHLVQVDVDVQANMRTLSQYDSSGSYGLPVLIVLSPSGSVRVDTNKSGNPGFDKSGFLAFLKKWAV